jgi:hypothetical protein
VEYPSARWGVMRAVAALSDRDYQQRVWINHRLPHPNYYDSVDLAIHTLFDDWAVLPNPREAIGAILVDGPEIERLQKLGQVLGALVDELKKSPDEEYVRDPRWSEVVDSAVHALSAMVLAGPMAWGEE